MGKGKNCSFRSISPFPTVFSQNIKTGAYLEKGRVTFFPRDKKVALLNYKVFYTGVKSRKPGPNIFNIFKEEGMGQKRRVTERQRQRERERERERER